MRCLCWGIVFRHLGEEGGGWGSAFVAGLNPAGPSIVWYLCVTRATAGTWFPCLLAAVTACVGRRPCSAGSLPVLLPWTFIRVGEEGRGDSPCLRRVFHWGNVCAERQPCFMGAAKEQRGRLEQLGISRWVGRTGDLWSRTGETGLVGPRFVRSFHLSHFCSFLHRELAWRRLVVSARVCSLGESKSKQNHV